MTASTHPITNDTPLKAIVSAPRSLRALIEGGFTTLGDVRGKIHEAAGLKWVGPDALAELASAVDALQKAPEPSAPAPAAASSAQAVSKQDPAVEESTHPLVLSSPHSNLRISWLPANKITQPGGGYAQQEPLWIEFDDGIARVGRELWFMRKYLRDRARVADAINQGEAWRVEAAAYIRQMRNFGRDYFLLGE